MSAFERLLVPGCAELPVCRCGEEMQIVGLDRLPGKVTPTRGSLQFGLLTPQFKGAALVGGPHNVFNNCQSRLLPRTGFFL